MLTYSMEAGSTSYEDAKRNTVLLCNFEARIVEEHRFVDGKTTDRFYLIAGITKRKNAEKPENLTDVLVHADEFSAMSWINTAWGSQVIIFPAPAAKEILRTVIQLESTPTIKTIYTHTGWLTIGGKPTYLTARTAIDGNRRNANILTRLPRELDKLSLPEKSSPEEVKAGVDASIALAEVAPPDIAWSLLGAVYRAPLGAADFAIHITGRTGTFKSEFAALLQSHWGPCTARELPASWSSTANALEALCYRAKNAVIIVDDFIPMGTSWQVKAYQKTADQLIRAQGNQAGRARLTDTSNLQQTMYPRGIIISTGEDTPEGHSVRARMLIGELTPGDIQPASLSKAQAHRNMYQHAMAGYIDWLARDLPARRAAAATIATQLRDQNLRVGHSRTPPTVGQLAAGVFTFMAFAAEEKHITIERANALYANALAAIKALAGRQNEYLENADPAEQFLGILRGIFAANAGHLKGINGGIPRKAQLLGWTAEGTGPNAEWKPHGPRLGWAEENTKTAYLDAMVVYDCVRRHSRGAITISRQTLYKRLREAGHLKKIDDTRQRNTVRVQCENAGRQALALSLNALTEGECSE